MAIVNHKVLAMSFLLDGGRSNLKSDTWLPLGLMLIWTESEPTKADQVQSSECS